MLLAEPIQITHRIAQKFEQQIVIVHKLYWYQLNGRLSERQWTDVLGVLQVQGEQLDYPYLERMAHQRGVRDLLTLAIKKLEQVGR